MPTELFVVQGTLIHHQTRQPLPGLKVGLWDKDVRISDQLGTAISDRLGHFTISFDASRFADHPLDNLPDVFFLVYQGDRVIHSTEGRPIKNAQALIDVVIEIDLPADQTPAPEPEPAYFVQGRVLNRRTQQPLAGFRVEGWDKDVRISDQLGIATTDLNGAFFLTYDFARFGDDQDRLPDVFFRVFVGDNLIHTTEGRPLKNAPQIRDLVLEVDLAVDDAPTAPPIFNQADVIGLAAIASQKPADLQGSSPDLFRRLQTKALSSVQQSVSAHFQSSSYELRYFIQKLDLSPLAQQETPIQSYVAEAISASRLPELVKQEGLAVAHTWNGSQTLGEVLRPDLDLRSNPLFADEFRQADLLQVGGLTGLSSKQIDHLLGQSLQIDTLSPEALDTLVSENVLSQQQAEEFGLNANLYQFSAGNLNLVNALKGMGGAQPLRSLRELAFVPRAELQAQFASNKIESPVAGVSTEEYPAFLHKQLEVLFPHEVFRTHHQPINEDLFARSLDRLAPLFAQNARLFDGRSFAGLNLEGIEPERRPKLESAYTALGKAANRYPGLELHAVLDDRELTPAEKISEAKRRVNLMEEFYVVHEHTPFLFLDYSPGSKDSASLRFSGVSESDKRLVVNNLKADQRLFRLTRDAEHTFLLKTKGYYAAYQIAFDSLDNFVQNTGLPSKVAKKYLNNAQDITIGSGARLGAVIDIVKDSLQGTPTDNTDPEIRPFLRRLEGFDALFGSQDFCKCEHCRSIISPAAYFVDLMDFVQTHVRDRHFSGTNVDHDHVLDPRRRRGDLWDSLHLSCDNTHTLVPYLTIILEILENYIAGQEGSGFSGNPSDRNAVESFVYERLASSTINSFRQPFHLPLVELQTYLQHFPISRSDVARTVLAHQGGTDDVIAQAELGLARREYELIQDAPEDEDLADLDAVYPFLGDTSGRPPESKQLLHIIGISREELTEVVKTKFVTPEGSAAIELRGEAVRGSVQINQELVLGLNLANLDRIHRFVRLWRRVDWSMGELDQVLQHVYAAGLESNRNRLPLPIIAQLQTLQKQLKVSVPELCALFHELPNTGEGSLCDRLFNLPVFTRRGGAGASMWPSTEAFQYPYPTVSADAAATQRLHRLLAGLGLKDDELFQLIEQMRTPLGGAASAPFSFALNLANLTRLYRHARLAKLLRLSIPQLFALLRMSPAIEGNYVATLADLQALLELTGWLKESGYSIEELEVILRDAYSRSGDEDSAGTTDQVRERLIEQILTEEALIFADTVFAFFEGITEAQSQAIIRANPALIAPADIRSYRIAQAVADPATVEITLPAEIQNLLDATRQGQLLGIMREVIATHRIPGAPELSDRVLVGVVGLTLSQSRAILGANPGIFEPASSPHLKYQIRASINPITATFTIPLDITADQRTTIISRLEQVVLTHFVLETPYLFDDIFAGNVNLSFDLSVDKSRAIIESNPSIFEPSGNYRIRPSANLGALKIPTEITEPLTPEERSDLTVAIRGALAAYSSSHSRVFPDSILEGSLGLTVAQFRAIIEANQPIFEVAYAVHPGDASLPIDIADDLTAEELDELRTIVRKTITMYSSSGSPTFLDNILVETADVKLANSRIVLAANPEVFELVEAPQFYWLSADFDPNSASRRALTIPASIPLRQEVAHTYLLRFYAPEVVAHQLGRQLSLASEKVKALSHLAGYDLTARAFGSTLTQILHNQAAPTELTQLIATLQILTVWFKDRVFDPTTLRFMQTHSGGTASLFQISSSDYRRPNLAHLRQTVQFQQLLKSLSATKGKPENLFAALKAFEFADPANRRFRTTALDSLTAALGTEAGLVSGVNGAITYPTATDAATARPVNRALEAFDKLLGCVRLAQFLGVGGEALPLMVSGNYADLDGAVAAIVTAIRTKYETEEDYQQKIGPFEDKIREQRRDALTDYLRYTLNPAVFQTTNDLYHYFLIDTELEGCARTSRVVAGIASLQLYIQRCLMNLEQSQDGRIHVLPQDLPAHEWEWRKNYRVWEANRKVFLYPENYIESDLRDNKTPLFEELESELLQQEINTQTVLDAYAKYMKGFEEIARLKIAGSYHDRANGADVLHLFGVTASEPPEYYYRTIENIYKAEEPGSSKGIVWNAWQKISLQIPVGKVSPIVYQGRLIVFWVEITTRPVNDMVAGSSRFTGYKHTMTVKFTTLRLDGAWSPPQKISLPVSDISDPLVTSKEISWVYRFTPFMLPQLFKAVDENGNIDMDEFFYCFHNALIDKVKKYPESINSTSESIALEVRNSVMKINNIDMTSTFIRNTLRPRYAIYSNSPLALHVDPIDNYELIGHRWERVYPEINEFDQLNIVIGDYSFNLTVDFYQLTARANLHNPTIQGDQLLPGSQRLFHIANSYFIGFPVNPTLVQGYANAVKVFNIYGAGIGNQTHLLNASSEVNSTLVNGALADAIIDIDGDILYLYSMRHEIIYILKRLGTSVIDSRGRGMGRILFENGLDTLLGIDTQRELREADLPVALINSRYTDEFFNDAQKAIDKRTPDFTGSLGVYYREIFFHIPFLIANHLNSQGKYADAQRWYHYIFDPTSNKLPPDPARQTDRVWQYIEFRNHTLQTLRDQLNDSSAEEAYKKDPFNPHAIARLRSGAYPKSIVMKYIDNLLDWGDQLFAQDTMESIGEATLLYVMAADLLGPRPLELGDCGDETDQSATYNDIKERIESGRCLAFVAETEHLRVPTRGAQVASRPSSQTMVPTFQLSQATFIAADFQLYADRQAPPVTNSALVVPGVQLDPDDARLLPGPKGIDWKRFDRWQGSLTLSSFSTSFLKQACVFCIPPNPDLLGYWDRVEDRLYKIRNCLNIRGLRRELALFAPEIDPRLLVKAKAAGISLEDILNSTSGNLPPYRFSFLIVKAKEYAGALQSFGAALLGAIEKKEAEELARLRLVHQDTILKLTTKLRDQEIAAAEASLEALRLRRDAISKRRDYYADLIQQGLIPGEVAQQLSKYYSSVLLEAASPFSIAASVAAAIPYLLGLVSTTGAEEAKEVLSLISQTLQARAGLANRIGELAGLEAGNIRREQGWKHTLQQIEEELKENVKHIQAAEIRRDISLESRKLHEKTLEQAQDVLDFYQDKFTNLGLYTWLSTQLQRLYREAYQSAMAMARLAERAYRFERGDDTTLLLDGSYWDSSHAGLLAGDRLMSALRQMERVYMETHYRSLEIDQAFSLTQIDPAALVRLKETGECEFSIPELYFDLFYPGHYRRRIKSARLTIPCITGPYTNVSATLTLTGSHIRKDPRLGREHLLMVPPTRSVSIATSTAQNDSGVFRLDFRDERYMPFEGAGAISDWKLTLPKNFRQFDYQTITDVILHISYTAEHEYTFQVQVEGENAATESVIRTALQNTTTPLRRIFSLRQEFSNPFNRLLRSALNQSVVVEINEKRFPIFLQGALLSGLQIQSARVVLVTPRSEEPAEIGPFSLSVDGTEIPRSNFGVDDTFGGLFTTNLDWTGPVTSTLLQEHSFAITNAGNLGPAEPTPSNPSAIDPEKLIDILLYLEFVLP